MKLDIDVDAIFRDSLRNLRNKRNQIESRDRMLATMGIRDSAPPFLIDNAIDRVINPWIIAKCHSEKGLPKEIALECVGNDLKVDWEDYWTDWCDFWFNSFIRIPHNILLDSKKYFEALEKVELTSKKGKQWLK